MIIFAAVLSALAASGYAVQHLRWMRVLQGEEFRPLSVLDFYGRWAFPKVNVATVPRPRHGERPWPLGVPILLIVVGIDVANADPIGLFAMILYCLAFPLGMPVRGRERRVRWDRRAVSTTSLAVLISTLGLIPLSFTSRPWLVVTAAIALEPIALTLAAALLTPAARKAERRAGISAQTDLARASSRVVLVIGSHGKRSVAAHLASLVGPDLSLLATSGECRGADAARAIVAGSPDGPCTVVAPVRVTRPRDVAGLARWCRPDVVVIAGLSARDLPRRRSLDDVTRYITDVAAMARTVILCADDERVRDLASVLATDGRRVRLAGTSPTADVRVSGDGSEWLVEVDHAQWTSATVVSGVYQSNVACAVAAAIEVGMGGAVHARLDRLTPLPHHVEARRSERGALVIDDSAAASPMGGLSAIEAFAGLDIPKERWVISAGLFHAGADQDDVNAALASDAVAQRMHIAIVGRTNLVSWRDCVGDFVRRFDTMYHARQWAEENLGPGDGVLYLGEAPDYYP